VPTPYTGPSLEEVHEARARYLSPALAPFLLYKKPVMITQGKMQYVWDDKGKRYLDAFGGIVTVSVGHAHPKVLEAGIEQMKKVQHLSVIYHNPEIAMFAKELAAKFAHLPNDLSVVYFTNSGSEANDLALLMARMHTGNNDVLALRNCYHGMSYTAMGLTALNTWKYPVPQGDSIRHVQNPNVYRGKFGPNDDPALNYSDDVLDVIRHCTPGGVAGYISETIQGVGGSVELPQGYLAKTYEHVRNHGGICIADEVQTGFGRLGTHYWGFETQGVVPDMVTMAKGIGNGAPLAAVITTPEIAASMKKGLHFNTYGGNPVSSAIGRAVLKVIDEEGIQENALRVGDRLIKGLKQLKEKHQIVGDVRGRGLMLGMELVKDRKTKAPATAECLEALERCKDMGLLIGKGGLFGNTFRIKPPMCLTEDDADFIVACLDRSLEGL